MYERMSAEMFSKLETMFWVIADGMSEDMSPKDVAEFVCKGYGLHFIKSVDGFGDLYESTFEGFVYITEEGFDWEV